MFNANAERREAGKPVPALSRPNVLRLLALMTSGKIDTIIEYGSGNSTLYFLDLLRNYPLHFISVENSKRYFFRLVRSIEKTFPRAPQELSRNFWTPKQYSSFLSSSQAPYTPIQEGSSRLHPWKRQMQLGPLSRVESILKGRCGGRLSLFWGIFEQLNKIFRTAYFQKIWRRTPYFANERSIFSSNLGAIRFRYELVSPQIKDQFGESPNRSQYAFAGLRSLEQHNRNILVMIDGGPRHFLVDFLFDNLKNRNVHLFLFDAHRPEYESTLKKHSGQFFPGTLVDANGEDLYSSLIPDRETLAKQLKYELWYARKEADE